MDKKHELFPRVHSRLQATEEPADKMQAFEGIHVTEGIAAETPSINTAYSTCRLYPAALCYLVWGIKSFYPLHHLGIECWKQKIMEITEVRSLCPSDWGEIFQITGNINHYITIIPTAAPNKPCWRKKQTQHRKERWAGRQRVKWKKMSLYFLQDLHQHRKKKITTLQEAERLEMEQWGVSSLIKV